MRGAEVVADVQDAAEHRQQHEHHDAGDHDVGCRLAFLLCPLFYNGRDFVGHDNSSQREQREAAHIVAPPSGITPIECIKLRICNRSNTPAKNKRELFRHGPQLSAPGTHEMKGL